MAEWQDTMERLVRDRERALLSYAYLVCGDPVRAQDLVQDALVRTFSRERKGLTVLKAEGYVRRAITSVFIDEYRRSQRWERVQHVFRPQETEPDRIRSIEAGSDVHVALATLLPASGRAWCCATSTTSLCRRSRGTLGSQRAPSRGTSATRWAGSSWPLARSRTSKRPSR